MLIYINFTEGKMLKTHPKSFSFEFKLITLVIIISVKHGKRTVARATLWSQWKPRNPSRTGIIRAGLYMFKLNWWIPVQSNDKDRRRPVNDVLVSILFTLNRISPENTREPSVSLYF